MTDRSEVARPLTKAQAPKWLIAIVLTLCIGGFAQTHADPTIPDNSGTVTSTPAFSIEPAEHYVAIMTSGDGLILVEDKDHKLMVRVNADGTVEYGKDYKPTDGARAFWQELAKSYWGVCEAHQAKEPKRSKGKNDD